VTAAFLLAVTLAGCGADPVEVDGPRLSGRAARVCGDLLDALPDRVAGRERRAVEDAGSRPSGRLYAAAWGDPAIELVCGVDEPPAFDRFATCQVVNKVAWFIPESQITGEPTEVVMTTVRRSENVQVTLPQEYWPPAAAMVDLAPAIKRALPAERSC
jgi:hypothetical protein